MAGTVSPPAEETMLIIVPSEDCLMKCCVIRNVPLTLVSYTLNSCVSNCVKLCASATLGICTNKIHPPSTWLNIIHTLLEAHGARSIDQHMGLADFLSDSFVKCLDVSFGGDISFMDKDSALMPQLLDVLCSLL